VYCFFLFWIVSVVPKYFTRTHSLFYAQGQSPAGTPLKPTAQTTPNNKPTFSTDLAPTPPMSPSASLDDSSSKIGNIFSTGGGGQFVNDKKFMSQRAAEKDKNKSTPSKLNSGIAIGSSGNSVLNRIQKLSNFDVSIFYGISYIM
jgi:hypothetical protein